MLLVVSDQVLHIAIDVSFVDEQIQGQICDGLRRPKPFSGWLGLIGALDGMVGSPHETSALPSAGDCVRRAETGGDR
jgi:hypothetical protein